MKYEKVADYIHVENVIPRSLCEEVVGRIKDAEWRKHLWYNDLTNATASASEKELDVLSCPPEIEERLVPFLVQAGRAYHAKYAYLESPNTRLLMTKLSSIRFNRYLPGNIMRMHHDHIHDLFDGKERGIPVLSFVGNLNAGYEGGDLVFFGDYRVTLNAGDILMFPSNFVYPHQVDEVTKSVRYSFVSWAW